MQKITEAANWVSQKLAGPYEYKENHYQNLLIYALQKRGYVISTEENLTYTIQDGKHSVVIGYGRLDLKVIAPDGEVFILELKVAETLKYSLYMSWVTRQWDSTTQRVWTSWWCPWRCPASFRALSTTTSSCSTAAFSLFPKLLKTLSDSLEKDGK